MGKQGRKEKAKTEEKWKKKRRMIRVCPYPSIWSSRYLWRYQPANSRENFIWRIAYTFPRKSMVSACYGYTGGRPKLAAINGQPSPFLFLFPFPSRCRHQKQTSYPGNPNSQVRGGGHQSTQRRPMPFFFCWFYLVVARFGTLLFSSSGYLGAHVHKYVARIRKAAPTEEGHLPSNANFEHQFSPMTRRSDAVKPIVEYVLCGGRYIYKPFHLLR